MPRPHLRASLLAPAAVAAALLLGACSSSSTSGSPTSAPATAPGTPGPGSTTGTGGFAISAGGGFASQTTFDKSSTCDNPGDYSAGVNFVNVPAGTAQLGLTMVDTDIDKVHWIQLIPGDATGTKQHSLVHGATELTNDFGEASYDGPCPPAGSTHHYLLTVSALPKDYTAPAGADPRAVVSGIRAAASATATLEVTYTRA